MKLVLIFCFVSILTICVATDVKVYVYDGDEYFDMNRPKPEPRESFIFGYHRGDVLSMDIIYRSIDKNVDMSLYIQYPLGGVDSRLKLSPKKSVYYPGQQLYEIWRTLNYSEIVIELESNTTSGVFTRKQIVRGVEVTGLQNETNYIPYNDVCIRYRQHCVIQVDLLNNVNADAPLEKGFTNKTDLDSGTTNESGKNTNTTDATNKNSANTTETVSKKHDAPLEKGFTNKTDLDSGTTNESGKNTNTTDATNYNSANTTETVSKEHDANTTYYIIIPSISAVVAVVLVSIFAIKTRCWKKCDRSVRPLQPLQPTQPAPHRPYYENVVFRGQCDLEIQAREEPYYEEIM